MCLWNRPGGSRVWCWVQVCPAWLGCLVRVVLFIRQMYLTFSQWYRSVLQFITLRTSHTHTHRRSVRSILTGPRWWQFSLCVMVVKCEAWCVRRPADSHVPKVTSPPAQEPDGTEWEHKPHSRWFLQRSSLKPSCGGEKRRWWTVFN